MPSSYTTSTSRKSSFTLPAYFACGLSVASFGFVWTQRDVELEELGSVHSFAPFELIWVT